MSEWMWVALGYSIAYGALAVYFAAMHHRWRAVERKNKEVS
ncbi:hypothetical protein REH65_32815 [Saccharopolyspora sp. ID03-671]